MVVTCSAPGCSNKKDSSSTKLNIQFHRFPLRKAEVLAKWVKAMKSPSFKPSVTSYLCSAHFSASDYYTKPNVPGKHLKPTAVPNLVDKKRPGRKKKFTGDAEAVEEAKDAEENNESKEAEEAIEEEYLDVGATDQVQSNLADIISNEEKGVLHVLIVGEDGKITNSEYILKKELFSDEESKKGVEDSIEGNGEKELEDENVSHEILGKDDIYDKESQTDVSQEEVLVNFEDMKSKEKIKRLEAALLSCRKKVKVWQMKCRRRDKKISELKLLLKLLVLKRGRGEKNLKQLLEDYEKMEAEELKLEVKEETNF